MKKNTQHAKKVLFTLFAMLMPLLIDAQTKVEIEGIWYNLTSETLQAEVTFKGSSYSEYTGEYSGSVTIPTIVTYEGVDYNVTSIESDAFRNCSSLTSITIPENSRLTSIGGSAFRHCSSLTSITIPSSVTSIGNHAFFDCSSLTDITIPENVTTIGEGAFRGCSSLRTITIPENVTSIESDAFYNCSNLTDITLPEGVTSIGEYAFNKCSRLTTITIPSSVTSIGKGAFYDCSSLSSFTIPSSVISIGSYAFDGCSSLTSIIIPSSVTSIGEFTFAFCSSLTSIIISPSVTSIGSYAFYECSSLRAITILSGVTSIGERAFYNCSNLSLVINLSALNILKGSTSNGYVAYYAENVVKESGVIDEYYFINTEGVHHLAHYAGNDTALVLPEDYQGDDYVIADFAFIGNENLVSVTIPQTVGSIGNSAFAGCTNLASVEMARGVMSIEDNAFENCVALSSVVIPQSMRSIGDNAFVGCTAVKTLTVLGDVMPTVPSELLATIVLYSSNPLTTAEFAGKVYRSATVYVPTGSLDSYKAADVWKNFWTIKEFDTTQEMAISLNLSTVTLTEDESFILTATITPEFVANIAVTWSTSDTSVATVDETGTITALAAGTVTITATANDGSGVSASCEVTVKKKVVAVACITLNQTTATLTEGETLPLTATVTPDDAADKSISWSSNNPSIAIVDNTGKVTAVAPGIATITATANDGSGESASCEVIVEKKVAAVACITLSQSSATLTEGKSITLTATVTPEDADDTSVTWSSSDEDVALVNSKGKVVAIGLGTATITVTANDGSGVSASCEIRVVADKCATPTISYDNGEIILTCDTKGAEIRTTATTGNDNEYVGTRFEFTPTYTFTACATKDLYEDSDVVTLTICWIPCDEEHNGTPTNILSIPSKPVLIQSQGGTITLNGISDDTEVVAYDLAGNTLGEATATGGAATLTTNLTKGDIVIVKIGNNSIKIAIK